VKGPCRVRNAGRIEFGDGCILDSTKEHPICLDVGNQAVLSVGPDVYFNEGTHIVANVSVTFGARCLIGSEVLILDDDGHPVDWRARHGHWPEKPEDRLGAAIVIEDNVWIGSRAIILKGVHIGSGSVVAAGAVVTHSVPPVTLVGGVPAKIIRKIDEKAKNLEFSLERA
jgi:acetyltransferase-like isoleucine patch superfamily enzyme